MPRRREVPKREILPDPKFGNVEVAKFMNVIMQGGKKAVAERIIYGAFEQIEKKGGGPAQKVLTLVDLAREQVVERGLNLGAATRADNKIQQFAHLIDIAAPADTLRRRRVPFEKDRITPVDHLQAIGVPLPEQVFGIHIVVDDLVRVGGDQQIQQRIDDHQHFQFRQPFVTRGQFQHQIADDQAVGAFDHDVLMRYPADDKLPRPGEGAQRRVPGQPQQRLPLVEDTHLLPGADRRGVVGRGALDHHWPIAVVRIDRPQRLTTAATRVDIVIAVTVIEQAVGHRGLSPSSPLLYGSAPRLQLTACCLDFGRFSGKIPGDPLH